LVANSAPGRAEANPTVVRTDERVPMKHAKTSTPRDVANEMLFAVGARRVEVGGRHRAAVAGDEWTPSSKLEDRQAVVPKPRHRAAS
jgi:hypothetical protein